MTPGSEHTGGPDPVEDLALEAVADALSVAPDFCLTACKRVCDIRHRLEEAIKGIRGKSAECQSNPELEFSEVADEVAGLNNLLAKEPCNGPTPEGDCTVGGVESLDDVSREKIARLLLFLCSLEYPPNPKVVYN